MGDIHRVNTNSNSEIIRAENFILSAPQLATLPHIVTAFYREYICVCVYIYIYIYIYEILSWVENHTIYLETPQLKTLQ